MFVFCFEQFRDEDLAVALLIVEHLDRASQPDVHIILCLCHMKRTFGLMLQKHAEVINNKD